MGRKQNGRGKHLLFLVAGLILLLLGGCASFEKFLADLVTKDNLTEEEKATSNEAAAGVEVRKKSDQAKLYLSEGKRLLRQGEFDSAFREYQKAAVLLKKNPPADEAFFYMGLIQAYPENPRKDYRRSLEFMKSVITDFPQSSFTEPAKAWSGLLLENERLVRASEKNIQEKEHLTREQEKLYKSNEKLVRDHDKITKENEKLNKMLEELKQVDIEMEGKRREKGR